MFSLLCAFRLLILPCVYHVRGHDDGRSSLRAPQTPIETGASFFMRYNGGIPAEPFDPRNTRYNQNPTSPSPSSCEGLIEPGEATGLQIHYAVGKVTTVQGDVRDTLSVGMSYSGGKRWLGFAISEQGAMVDPPSDSVIGLPDEDKVTKYKLISKGSNPDEVASQTLMDTSIEYNPQNTTTIMRFTKYMNEPDEIPINIAGANRFLWAYGSSAALGYHGGRGTFEIDFSKCVSQQIETKDYRSVWVAHAVMGAIAWGFAVPIALSVAWLRSFLPPNDVWFKLHMTLNVLGFLLTVAVFCMAVIVFSKAGNDHFSVPHHKVGLSIMVIVTVQVIGGLLRPKKHHTDYDLVVADQDSSYESEHNERNNVAISVRKTWEIAHKTMGVALLSLGLYQVDSGLKLYSSIYSIDTSTYLNAYWGWIGTFGGIVLILTLVKFYRKFNKG